MNNYYVDPAAAGSPWTEVRLPEEAQTLRAYALGNLGRLGIWALYEDGPDVALTFTTFPDRYGKTINLAYEELPAHATSMRVVASASGSKPDVYVAGDGIAVYRSGTHEAPEKVAGAAGATLVWADRTGSTERVAYTDAGNAVWLTTKPADGAWSVPIKIAEGVRRAVLCASADGASVDLVVLTPGGALELRSLDSAATASEIPQRAVWEEAPLSAADLGRVIASCAPLIYFDEKEQFLPSDVEFYLRTVGFWDEIHGRWQLKNGTLWDAAARDLRAEALAILPRSAPDNSKRDCDYNLRIDEADFDHLKGGRLNGAPIYVHAKFKPADNCTDLVFWSFYPYNGPGTLRLTAAGSTRYSSLDPLGVHEGDWEHFTIRVDNDSLQPQKIYMSAHDGGDWVDFASLEQDGATGRKVVYVSRNGHATYAQAGDNAFHEQEGKLAGVTVWAFALVNICSKGPAWKTWENGTTRIVSAGFLGPKAPVEPRWIAFPWRWGRYRAVSQDDMAGVIRTVLGPIGNMPFAAAVEEAVGKAVVDSGVLGGEGYSAGPGAIKFKSNWFAAE